MDYIIPIGIFAGLGVLAGVLLTVVSKIFAVKNLFVNLVSAIMGIMASFLLNKLSTAYCMIIVGIIFTIMYILMGKYMKLRVGPKPEEYSRQERKYDELK